MTRRSFLRSTAFILLGAVGSLVLGRLAEAKSSFPAGIFHPGSDCRKLSWIESAIVRRDIASGFLMYREKASHRDGRTVTIRKATMPLPVYAFSRDRAKRIKNADDPQDLRFYEPRTYYQGMDGWYEKRHLESTVPRWVQEAS